MRAFIFGCVAALTLSSPSWADTGRAPSNFWIPPKTEVLKEQWPRNPRGGLIYGEVKLDCTIGANGFAANCKVKSSEPADRDIEKAALALAPLFKAGKLNTPPAPLEVSLKYDVNPNWLRKPTSDDIWLVWPRKAARMGISGAGVIKCVVNLQGLLQACSIDYETPPGRGFGQAALQLAPTFLMSPGIRDGQPVESEITIPVNFGTDNGAVVMLPNALVIDNPAWSKTPSVAEILAQLDKKVGDRFADGKVVFMCSLNKKTGKIGSCDLANASHGMTQFVGVANALAAKFEADPKILAEIRASLDPTETEAKVFMPFSFPDMASPTWGTRYESHVRWDRVLGPSPGHPLFPQEAVKAGLKAGSAIMDCLIGADGGLSQCHVVSESTPNVGFGEMAKTIAEQDVANRWSEEGLPVEGARVRMPINMVYDEKAAAAVPPAAKP